MLTIVMIINDHILVLYNLSSNFLDLNNTTIRYLGKRRKTSSANYDSKNGSNEEVKHNRSHTHY